MSFRERQSPDWLCAVLIVGRANQEIGVPGIRATTQVARAGDAS
jgi:hypothetical protein